MASSINGNIPQRDTDLDADPIRSNFQHAKDEIEELQDRDAEKLRGRNISSQAPTNGQALVWNQTSSHWRPETIAGGGDGDAHSIHGRAIASTTPTNGQALVWHQTGTQWRPETISGGGGGDATSIHGRSIASAAPTDGQVLEWNQAGNTWRPHTLPGGGGGGGVAVAHYANTAPASPANGTLWFNSTTGILAVWAQVTWININ